MKKMEKHNSLANGRRMVACEIFSHKNVRFLWKKKTKMKNIKMFSKKKNKKIFCEQIKTTTN